MSTCQFGIAWVWKFGDAPAVSPLGSNPCMITVNSGVTLVDQSGVPPEQTTYIALFIRPTLTSQVRMPSQEAALLPSQVKFFVSDWIQQLTAGNLTIYIHLHYIVFVRILSDLHVDTSPRIPSMLHHHRKGKVLEDSHGQPWTAASTGLFIINGGPSDTKY